MANPLTSTFASLFRSKADVTSLKRLQREGIRTVSVLDLSRLEEFIGEAIERAAGEGGANGTSPQGLARGAQVEFLKLLGDARRLEAKNDDLKREQSSLEGNLAALQQALQGSQSQLAASLERADHEALAQMQSQLQALLGDSFARLRADLDRRAPGSAAALAGVEAPLRDGMLALLSATLQRTHPGAPTQEEMNVELLERRVRKLTATLDETRSLLARVRDDKADAAAGVPSVYKEAQGLQGNEAQIEQRRALMREIFEHNLELQRALTGKAP